MKKCLICKKEISEKKEVCENCKSFFEWKEEKSLVKHLERLVEYFSKRLDSIKFRRQK